MNFGLNKVSIRPTGDAFKESGRKILKTVKSTIIDQLFETSKNLRHFDDLDPSILVVAAYLYLAHPSGPLWNTKFPEKAKLEFYDLNTPLVLSAIDAILSINGVSGKELVPKIKADIFSYYWMFFE